MSTSTSSSAREAVVDHTKALALVTTLRSITATMKDNSVKKLQAQLGDPGGANRSLDRSGAQIQHEALQVAMLMHGLRGCSEKSVIEALRKHDADPQVASFMQYWASLSLMAGVVAPGGGDHVQTAYIDWYRGDPGQARHMPNLNHLRGDLDAFVLQGWAPDKPPIRQNKLVTALGSCFADEIRLWLKDKGYRVNDDFRSGQSYPHLEDSAVPLLQCSAGLVNTFVLLQQFEWALEGKRFEDDLWVGAKGTIATPTEAARLRTKEMFLQTNLFVITLGLSEVWYQKRGEGSSSGKEEDEEESDDDSDDDLESEDEEGEDFFAERDVLWRAVPSDRYDPERHGFRATTVSENLTNLKKIVKLIRTHVPKASIVFTLSPVPLAATFRGVSCVTANATSKAVLRVAVDELMRENGLGGHRPRAEKKWKEQRAAQLAAVDAGRKDLADAGKPPNALFESASKLKEKPGLYYWPAYEMVKEGFRDPYMDDGRHPRPEVVKEILELFGKYYLPAEGEEVEEEEEEEEEVVEGGDKVDDDEEEEDGKTDPPLDTD